MAYYSRPAKSAAFNRCHETCQKVRSEIHEAIEKELETQGIDLSVSTIAALTDAAFAASLEYGTEKVRAALIECEEELLEAQKALDTAEDDLKDAKRQVDSLEEEVAALESELDTARSS